MWFNRLHDIATPLCAVLCGVIGLILLIRWPHVQPAVSAGFIIGAVALWLAWREQSNWEKAVRLISKLALLGLGLSQLFHIRSPEQMSGIIAAGFTLIAISLLVHFLTNHKNHALSRSLSYVVFALAWSIAIAHVYRASPFSFALHGHASASGMIVSGFLILSLGLATLHSEQVLKGLSTRGNLTSFQLGTLLPAVLLLPFLVGLLVIQGLPLFGPNAAVALTVIGSTLIAALIVLVSTMHLRSAERKLREMLVQINEARIAAESANDTRDRFASFVGHELRAPLNSALTWADLMEVDPSKENVEDGIKVIKHSIATLVRLIDDLGEVAKVTAGRFAIHAQRVDLVELLRAACTESQPQLAEGEVKLNAEIPAYPCISMGDPVRIQQVFRNLLSNARKYVQPGGQVDVEMRVNPDQAVVVVRDNGPGLTPEQCGKIFDPFYRAEPTSQGLGIGLAITRAIMEAHGGSIDAASEGPGSGCTFTLRFTRTSDDLQASVDIPESAGS